MLNEPHRERHLFLHSKFQTGRNTCFGGIQEYLQGTAVAVNYAENRSISDSNFTLQNSFTSYSAYIFTHFLSIR